MELCTNCNRPIGNLETHHLYESHVVCGECHARLEASARGQPMMYATPAVPGDGSGKSVASLVLGIVGMLAWIIPLFGLPITITGLVMGIKGLKSAKRTTAAVGMILSIVGLIFSVINAAIGAYLGATGQLFHH